ncbi:MAG: ABC transporter substrate-binding protein [Actinobacteria bacterium]|nr:ABC transporter substrate-binding protein [Actinomycetota bacterium]
MVRRGRSSNAAVAVATALALILAACGSTSHKHSAAKKGLNGLTADSSPTSSTDVTPVTDASGKPVPAAARGVRTSGSGAKTGAAPAKGNAPVPGVSIGGTAHGINLKNGTITLGEAWADAAAQSAALSAIGAGDLAPGDPKLFEQTVINDMNKNGGILGLKVLPAYHEVKVQDDPASSEQATCDAWTKDTPGGVFAGFGPSAYSLGDCLEQRGVARLSAGFGLSDEAEYKRDPHFYETALNLNRVATESVDGLAVQNYFAPYFPTGTKIGVLTYDTPNFNRALNDSLLPALARRKLPAPEVVKFIFPPSLPNSATFGSQMNNAVLKFSSQHIDHVIILEAGGRILLEFTQRAERASYRPRYGLNSANGATTLARLNALPKAQLHNSLMVGWIPQTDQSIEDYPDNTGSASRQHCLQIMKDAGYKFVGGNDRVTALIYCEVHWLLKASLEAGGKAISLDSYLAGIKALQGRFDTSVTFGADFRAHHDGVSAGRDATFVDGCTCFRYTGGQFPIP